MRVTPLGNAVEWWGYRYALVSVQPSLHQLRSNLSACPQTCPLLPPPLVQITRDVISTLSQCQYSVCVVRYYFLLVYYTRFLTLRMTGVGQVNKHP